MSSEGVLPGRGRTRRASPSFETAPPRLAQAIQLRDLAIGAREVFAAFQAELEAGRLPRRQHAALRQLEQVLPPISGQPGAVGCGGAGGSTGARPPDSPTDLSPAAASFRGARS